MGAMSQRRSGRPRSSSPRRQFARTDRISEAVRSIVATELERIGDERLDLVTVTGVVVDGDLATAKVYYSALVAEQEGRADSVVDAFGDVRRTVQQAVNQGIRARRTPQVSFLPDDVLTSALRIDDLLAGRVESAVAADAATQKPLGPESGSGAGNG